MKTRKIILAFGLILFLLPTVIMADDLEDGIPAFERKEYEEAFELLKPLADEN